MNIWELDKAMLFLILVLPGFISMKVYSSIIASDKIDFSKSLVDAVCFSALNFGILAFPISFINKQSFIKEYPAWYWIGIFLVFVAFPTFWPFAYLWITKIPIIKKLILGPHNEPWVAVFSKKEAMWVTIKLKSGKIVRGKYGKKSKASTYPHERQIYLEEMWTKNEKNGFGKKINRTQGIIVSENEMEYIEFYK
jgi:hypothetical protein